MAKFEHETAATNAQLLWEWVKNRGGIAVWKSADLSDPDKSWTTPALTPSGQPTIKPHWKCFETPQQIITDAEKIGVFRPVEVRRFAVAIRRGTQGLVYKLTDASSAKVRGAVAIANDKLEKEGKEPGAFYQFDYSTQEAVIYIPGDLHSLAEWAKTNGLQ